LAVAPGASLVSYRSEAVFTGRVESPEDRFRAFDNVTEAVRGVAGQSGLVVILDDIHLGDEPSLLILRYLTEADRRRKTAGLCHVP
jgi:predicted ATPase